MERRILLAFTLSFVVFVVYMRFQAPKPGEIPVQPPPRVEEDLRSEKSAPPDFPTAEVEPAPPPTSTPYPASSQEVGEAERREASGEQQVEVDTPLFRALFTNRGAKLISFVLKEYEDGEGNPYEMVSGEGSRRLEINPLAVRLEDAGLTAAVETALFEVSNPSLRLRDRDSAEIEFSWADGRGLEVEKRIRFHGRSYLLDVEVSARRAGAELRKQILYGPGVGEESLSGTYVQPDKGVMKAGEEFLLVNAGDIKEGTGAALAVQAVGVAAHYFVALMLPAEGQGYGAQLFAQTLEPQGEEKKPRNFITAAQNVPAEPAEFGLYVGPKEHDRLIALGTGMERVIDYGWMRIMALPLRSALLWIHGYVGNYGWSIVLLTVLINIALIPLKHHSYVSMRKMQKLSPQIKKINERFKKLKPTDPKQQEKNQEVMKLYKEHKVSPISGCLPMLLMIPFFFAFYRLLMVSIELRHAPFGLWIQDLSTFDPYFVLPILMGVTQIGIQKMSPQTSADPMQAKIMMLMPVMFMFILAWAPAGLVLYWFVNNLVSIGQQTFTNRLLKDKESTGGAKSGGKSKKSKKLAAGGD
jgi:YidC/Oxa1 family membrane protein insertase